MLRARFEVADHIGCVAASKAWLVGAKWDARKVYHWSRDGAQLEEMVNPRKLAWQDIKIVDGRAASWRASVDLPAPILPQRR